jgi:hypothetical protein
MQRYVHTIGHLQASYVIRKVHLSISWLEPVAGQFLDSQRINNLVTCLQKLHFLRLANWDHATLLLNTYTKLKYPSRLDSFIKLESKRNADTSDELEVSTQDIVEQTRNLCPNDTFAQLIKTNLEAGKTPIKSDLSEWKQDNGLIYYRNKIYVPNDKDLCASIVKLHHDSPVTGHPGCFKTQEVIQRHYWWPSMTTFIKKWIDGCAICQQMKVNTHPTNPALKLIKSNTTRPFEQVTVDFITHLLVSNGFNSIMVMVNHGLSKGVVYVPCTAKIDAIGAAQKFIDHVWK